MLVMTISEVSNSRPTGWIRFANKFYLASKIILLYKKTMVIANDNSNFVKQSNCLYQYRATIASVPYHSEQRAANQPAYFCSGSVKQPVMHMEGCFDRKVKTCLCFKDENWHVFSDMGQCRLTISAIYVSILK